MTTKEKILYNARYLFAKEGYEKVSTREIAMATDCNETTIFRNFKNKKNLLNSIIENFVENNTVIDKLHKNLTFNLKDDIKISILIYYNFLLENLDIFKLQLKLSDSENQKFIKTVEFQTHLVNHFKILFTENNIKFSPEIFTANILSTIIGEFLLLNLTKNKDVEKDKDERLKEFIIFFQNSLEHYSK